MGARRAVTLQESDALPSQRAVCGTIVRYMALQAGVDIRSFYDACDK